MAKRPRLTAAQRDQIDSLRIERGWSCERIARHMNVCPGAVSWYCLMEGIEKNGKPPVPKPYRGPMMTKRGNHVVRCFTQEDDKLLLELEAQGKRYSEIARALGRQRNSVVARLATLARREERAAAHAGD